MKPQPYYARLSLLAFMLLLVSRYFPAQPWHVVLQSTGIGVLIWAVVLLYLRKTGKSNWNGPNWGRKLRESPRLKRVLMLVPALCAAWIPILFLLNRRWGLSDGQLGFLCGVPLGISLVVLVTIKSKGRRSGCMPEETVPTQQSGTN
ncbi:MAG: hypothetical protein WA708_15945 [Acidobacteriaceae bacterium]